nr:reverse transcriptase domain-containing protein [Tanacetum cinerariifolium]
MTHLLEKETPFVFSKECIDAFNNLKKKLTEALILVVPDWNLPFELMCDASDYSIGVVLGQRKTKHFQPIHYASKKMTEAQIHYTTTEKEMLTVDDEPAEVQEVVDVVTITKLITEVVTAVSETVTAASAIIFAAEPQVAAATITAIPVKVVAAPSRRRKGVVIRDPKEESTTSSIITTETKSIDKGKRIMVEDPKPLKKKQHIEMDEEYARKLHAEINKDINWDVAIDHVKLKAKEDPAVQRYQVMKRKPQTEGQARKNMMTYLKNVAGFKLDYFKGMSYDDIRLIFEAKFNSNIEFLLTIKEQMEEEENRAL